MKKISTILEKIIKNQPLLLFGMSKKLFNLSRLARVLKPLVEVQTKKSIKESALIMNLCRMQSGFSKNIPSEDFYIKSIKNIVIYSNLVIITYFKTPNIGKELAEFYFEGQNKRAHVILSQRTNEITIIIEEALLPTIKKIIKSKPRYLKEGVSSIGIQFSDESYTETPGLFLYILQQISLQGINIWEISSTYSELTLYINKEDVGSAFESLHNLIEKKSKI